MALDHVHGPAFKASYRDAQRAVLDYAELVANGRMQGTLTGAALDQLVKAQKHLDTLKLAYIVGQSPDATEVPRT